jgi:hypothetical protein
VTPVQRFTSREKAIHRIWSAAERAQKNGPGIPNPQQQQPQRPETTAETSTEEPAGACHDGKPEDSKKAQMIALLKLDTGVSLDELVQVTGWQKHSVRGFLSGTMRKKMGLRILSAKNNEGARIYRIAS